MTQSELNLVAPAISASLHSFKLQNSLAQTNTITTNGIGHADVTG
ncbi:hypothetical protein [Pedobacter roseus]|jgi:hypothetical protein|nr:hypothetical protein [Pedobacter roseus]